MESDSPSRCSKCGASFPRRNIATLHFRVKHTSWRSALFTPNLNKHIEPHPSRTHKHFAYEHFASQVAQRACSHNRDLAKFIYDALESAILDNDKLCFHKPPAIGYLVGAGRYRRDMLHLATSLGWQGPEMNSELKVDDRKIIHRLRAASRSDTETTYIVQRLRGNAAADLLDLLDLIMRPAQLDALRFRAHCLNLDVSLEHWMQRVFVRLCASALQLPHRLCLSHVKLRNCQPANGGSYGDIYEGEFNGQAVALKSLRPSRTQNPGNRKAFYREIAIARGIHHKHICPIIGVDRKSFAQATCLVLPWMCHGNIRQYIEKVKWSAPAAIRLINEVASGLAHLHGEGIVHGDLHLGNILVDAQEKVALTDFGLSNFADTGRSCSSGQPGAVRFMAPEILDPDQFRLSQVRHTPQSDVYSFGQVSWEIYTGKMPFHHLHKDANVILAVAQGRCQQDRSSSPRKIPDPLWKIVQACWQFQPSRRPDSCSLLAPLAAIHPPDDVKIPLKTQYLGVSTQTMVATTRSVVFKSPVAPPTKSNKISHSLSNHPQALGRRPRLPKQDMRRRYAMYEPLFSAQVYSQRTISETPRQSGIFQPSSASQGTLVCSQISRIPSSDSCRGDDSSLPCVERPLQVRPKQSITVTPVLPEPQSCYKELRLLAKSISKPLPPLPKNKSSPSYRKVLPTLLEKEPSPSSSKVLLPPLKDGAPSSSIVVPPLQLKREPLQFSATVLQLPPPLKDGLSSSSSKVPPPLLEEGPLQHHPEIPPPLPSVPLSLLHNEPSSSSLSKREKDRSSAQFLHPFSYSIRWLAQRISALVLSIL